MLTLQAAQTALQAHAQSRTLQAAQVQQLLEGVSVTFAQILYVTQVQLAAAHKQHNICKVTSANVLLCSNVNAHKSVYARAVRKSAARYTANDAAAVAAFQAAQNYFVHTACYSIVAHAQHAHKLYLYAIYNNAQSIYMHNAQQVTKQYVAQYCTPSAAKQLLQQEDTVRNVTHNIIHNVHVRTIALSNIVAIRARKQLLHV